jgi:hypothetical protein
VEKEKDKDEGEKVDDNDPEEIEELLPETKSNEIKMSVNCDRTKV